MRVTSITSLVVLLLVGWYPAQSYYIYAYPGGYLPNPENRNINLCEEKSATAPAFYHTRPLTAGSSSSTVIPPPSTSTYQPPPNRTVDPNLRTSRRLQRVDLDEGPSLEEVERKARAARSLVRLQMSPSKEQSNNNTPPSKQSKVNPAMKSHSEPKKIVGSSGVKHKLWQLSASSVKKRKRQGVWGRSSYSKRKNRRRNVGLWQRTNEEESETGSSEGEELNSICKSDLEQTADVAEGRKTVCKSPCVEAEEKSSQERSTNKSPRRDSLNQCLSVDVNSRSPRGEARSPMPKSPATPKASNQLSPNIHHDTPSGNRLILPDSNQRSPRQRHSSGLSNTYRSQADNSCSLDCSQKSPRGLGSPQQRGVDKSGRLNACVIQAHDENSNLSAPQGYNTTRKTVSGTDKTDSVPIVVNGFVDSGISCSDSSNSNDSTEQMKQATSTQSMESSNSTQASSLSSNQQENSTEDAEVATKEDSPKFRMTRSRTQTRTQDRAGTESRDGRRCVMVDKGRLERLLDLTVILTEGFMVRHLEKLYNMYAQCIYQHRLEHDKMAMIEVMEKRLRQYTSSMSEKQRAQRALESHSSM